MFGDPDSAGSPPQTTIPSQVDAVPELAGTTAQQYGSLAQQLKTDLDYFVHNENLVAGLVVEGKENIAKGRKAVLDLVDSINGSMSTSAGVPAMYQTIDNAITSANTTLTSYLNDQRQIAEKVHPIAVQESSSGAGPETSPMHISADGLAPLASVAGETGQEASPMHIGADGLAPLARVAGETGQETSPMHISADGLAPLASAAGETGQEASPMHIGADGLAPLASAAGETGQETSPIHISADGLAPLTRATEQETPTPRTPWSAR
ncbi:hypothetical protein [Nocardia blacklockiae]|uniref:hypothetical protein n=1 Tax=Nocardia blacklockiae TaxID=480036 RepID=UPI001893BB4F|nr:hypothetical protein [Nocardia blacklockiae]MBF6174846.1 hypothetical protein [Nocardia blacklockiae]